jgi:peptide/nickel transport system ATP-binding protein
MEGEVLSIVGESGSGKSTLARLLAGLDSPTSGTVAFGGEILPSGKRERLAGKLQMVFQHPLGSLNPRLSVGTSVREPLRRSVRSSEASRRVSEVLAEVGLPTNAQERFPHEFSGGQAQRIAIARALVAQPKVVILDEPTSALDVSVQAHILKLLRELKEREELTYVFISHDLAVVRQISDRVAVMYAGEVVEVGDADQVFDRPRHWYTRKLLSAVPSPDPRQRGEDAASTPSPHGSEVTV